MPNYKNFCKLSWNSTSFLQSLKTKPLKKWILLLAALNRAKNFNSDKIRNICLHDKSINVLLFNSNHAIKFSPFASSETLLIHDAERLWGSIEPGHLPQELTAITLIRMLIYILQWGGEGTKEPISFLRTFFSYPSQTHPYSNNEIVPRKPTKRNLPQPRHPTLCFLES